MCAALLRGNGERRGLGLIGPLPALPETVLTYLFETRLAEVSFSGGAARARPEVAVLFGLLFVHVNCRTKVCFVCVCALCVCVCVCVFFVSIARAKRLTNENMSAFSGGKRTNAFPSVGTL